MSLEVAVKTEPKVSLQRPRFEVVTGNPIPWFWALTPKVNFLPAVLSFLPSSQTAAASGRAFVQTGEGTPSSRKTSEGYPVSAVWRILPGGPWGLSRTRSCGTAPSTHTLGGDHARVGVLLGGCSGSGQVWAPPSTKVIPLPEAPWAGDTSCLHGGPEGSLIFSPGEQHLFSTSSTQISHPVPPVISPCCALPGQTLLVPILMEGGEGASDTSWYPKKRGGGSKKPTKGLLRWKRGQLVTNKSAFFDLGSLGQHQEIQKVIGTLVVYLTCHSFEI